MSSEQTSSIQITDIAKQAEEVIPKLQKGNEMAVAAMQAITEITSEEQYEDVERLCVRVRETYTKMKTLRMSITAYLDQMKDGLMGYERPLSDADKASEYNRLRNLLGAFRQAEIEKKKQVEAAAAKKKERENSLVDIGASILTGLNDLMLTLTRQADASSEKYFKASTLEDFDERAKKYNQMRPNLKKEDYNEVFAKAPRRFDLWSEDEFIDIINTIKSQETLEKWNEELIKMATPVINEWRAKIPELKENLIKLKNASDDADRKRIADEQQAKADAEAKRRDQELERLNVDQNKNLSVQAELDKMNNEFVAQATVQELGKTGPVKFVLKFTDPKKTLPALTKIMYHCMIHPEFPGIQKRDKTKKLVMDEAGRPEYIESVQWWITFFLSKCDAEIEGTQVFDVAKTIIRK